MKVVYSGDTAKFPIEIEADGVVIPPSNTDKLQYVEVVVYSRMNAKNIVGRYVWGKALTEGWTTLTHDASADTLYLILSSEDTARVVDEELVMQVTTCISDDIMPDGKDISTGTAVFCKVKKRE